MLSKSQNKYIRSLALQKHRDEERVYLAEGTKISEEWLQSGEQVKIIVATEQWLLAHRQLTERHPEADIYPVTEDELVALSLLPAPNQVMLVVRRPAYELPETVDEWCIALDKLQDPGNMGTIIRIADWFGIRYIFSSMDSVDAYNPKVVQAAMGGHLRVQVVKTDLPVFLSSVSLPVIAATLGGTNIYEVTPPAAGVLVIGNESKGISESLQAIATQKIMIPRIGGAESLNAGVSAGIICAFMLRPLKMA